MVHVPSQSPRPPSRRYLSLTLPYLPTDRIFRQSHGRLWRSAGRRDGDPLSSPGAGVAQEPGAPLAIIAKVKSALRLVALDEVAEGLGLTRGMALADARAMIPALAVADDDPSADVALLGKVADWAERYTPLVALDPPGGLMLDITGAAHLFGGEEALFTDLVGRLDAQGLLVRAAIADTPAAAFAAARHGSPGCVLPGGTAEMLAPLPLAALRLEAETVAALDRVGLKRIGQVMHAPRSPLAARFGRELIRRLDQALGREEEAINPRRPVAALVAERRFAEPVSRQEDIAATLLSLAAALAGKLEAHGEGARALELALFRVDGAVPRVAVSTSRPVRSPKLVGELFREKFAGLTEEIDAGFGFDMMRLSVLAAAAADAVQVDLAGISCAAADLDQLIDRIGARLGPESVGRIIARDTHIPEEAAVIRTVAEEGPAGEARQPAMLLASGSPALSAEPIDRPLRLFAKPELVEAIAEVPDGPPLGFRWRRALYRVVRAEGPERIAAEWWRADTDNFTRDYFRVEDSAGHRFWLYREGLFGRETGTPRWYMHGVFA